MMVVCTAEKWYPSYVSIYDKSTYNIVEFVWCDKKRYNRVILYQQCDATPFTGVSKTLLEGSKKIMHNHVSLGSETYCYL